MKKHQLFNVYPPLQSTVGNKQRFYIVAQSPHEELTTRIFWQCVWEADVYLIVQLSEDLNYIPPNTNQRMEFGQVRFVITIK